MNQTDKSQQTKDECEAFDKPMNEEIKELYRIHEVMRQLDRKFAPFAPKTKRALAAFNAARDRLVLEAQNLADVADKISASQP